jgi:chromosome segregation ATPase
MSSPVNAYDHHTGAPTTDPKAVKKLEKKIEHEAKSEEKMLKSVMKDLSRTEKAEVKADTQITKAENALEKAKTLEQKRLKKQYDAERAHEDALRDIHKAEQEVQLKIQHHDQLKQVLEHKHAKVDAATQAQEEHDRIRNAKLNALHGPEPLSEASRMIPDATASGQPGVGQANMAP